MRAVSLLFHDVYLRGPDESGFQSPAANRYKLSLADFVAQLKGIATARTDAPVLARDLLRPTCESALPFVITVDDGGISYYTVMADLLETLGWRGHCFVSTDFIGRRGFLEASHIRELDARGHVIGSHSASHPARFSACPVDEMAREWSRSREVLEDVLGHSVFTASVPGGYFSADVTRAAQAAGIGLLFTSEPTTSADTRRECAVIGRFTVRPGDRSTFASKLVAPSPWTRRGAWTTWNAKGLIKPLLGSMYPRLADRLLASKAASSS